MFILFCFLVLVTAKAILKDLDLLALQPGDAVSLYGPSPNYYFGFSVSGAGDFNGDGIDDIIIGSPQQTSSFSGTSYLIFGKKGGIADLNLASLTPSQGFQIIGPNLGDSTGFAVSGVGDVNADSFADIVIGAKDAPTSNRGAAYVIFGTKDPITTFTIDPTTLQSSGKGFAIYGYSIFDHLGNAVNYAGDVNGDRVDDIIVGAYQADNGGTFDVGKAFVIFGRKKSVTPSTDINLASGLSNSLGFTIEGSFFNCLVGTSVSTAGDFNGDGIGDIIVGATQNPYTDPGAAYIIFGRPGITDIFVPAGLNPALGVIITGTMVSAYAGFSVSGLKDCNGDGIDDVIIGVPSIGPLLVGGAYVVFGRKGTGPDINLGTTDLRSNGLGFKIYGANSKNQLGIAVKAAGDINGDGLADIAVSTMLSGPMGSIPTAAAYVVFGNSSTMPDIDVSNFDTSQGIVIQNIKQMTFATYQNPISCAGDLDGNGGQDIVIGCPKNINSPNFGSVHIIYGTPPVSTNPLQGLVDTENYGTAVGRIIAMAASLFHSSSIIPLWFIFLEQILQYPKYLLIDYPPRLENLYDNPGFQLLSISYISEIPDQLDEKIPNYSLPTKFEEYGFDSNFLSNFWNSLMTLLIIIVLIVIALIADHCTVSSKSLHLICNKIKYKLKWNYIISMFTGMFCDIALFSSFEFRTAHFKSAVEWISFLLCIFINLAIILVSIKIALMIKKFARGKTYQAKTERRRMIRAFKEQFKSYEFIFEGLQAQTLKQQSYFLLFSLRFYLFYMIIGYLFEHTLVQAILVNIIGISTLLFLGFVRPFEEKLDFFVSLTQEGALQGIHLCVLLFALDDQYNFGNQGFRAVLGDIIIGCNGVFMGISLIYSFILALVMLKSIYTWISMKCKKPMPMSKSDHQTPPALQKSRPAKLPGPTEAKSEIDSVNESQLYLNNRSVIEMEQPPNQVRMIRHELSPGRVNNSSRNTNISGIKSSNTGERELSFRPRCINPRREERKRFEREKEVKISREQTQTQNTNLEVRK